MQKDTEMQRLRLGQKIRLVVPSRLATNHLAVRPKSPEDNLAIRNALEKIALEYAAHANKMDASIMQYILL
jgi:DNA-binding FadR family transcriptional regulator